MARRLTTEEFISIAKLAHNIKYDYSKVVYIDNKTKVKIICPVHGEFEQLPNGHIKNNGCYKCWSEARIKTTETFIKEAKLIHGNIYDYSNVIYVGNKTKIKITCPVHGLFEQTPSNHLNNHICVYCSGLNKKTTEEFINAAKTIHGDKYDYSNVIYTKSKNNVIINCPKHGSFSQAAVSHLQGSICPNCNNDINRKTTEEFIFEAELIHGNMYDYSNVDYLSSKYKVSIICSKHGPFNQKPRLHLEGKGCPVCKNSKGEMNVRNYLLKNNISFIPQHKFPNCRNINLLPFDFYLPDLNTCIEYNGRQHYEPVSIFGGDNGFKLTLNRDTIKSKYCADNKIPLIIIKYSENINEVLDSLFNFVAIIT